MFAESRLIESRKANARYFENLAISMKTDLNINLPIRFILLADCCLARKLLARQATVTGKAQ
jgi:hypothetical protein